MSAAVSEAVVLLEGRCAAIDKHYERFPDTADRTMEDTAKAIRLVLAALQKGTQPSRFDILERIRAFDVMAHYGEAEYERLADDLEALAQPNQPRDREEG